MALVLDPRRVDEQQVVSSVRVACTGPEALVADPGVWAQDSGGAFLPGTKPIFRTELIDESLDFREIRPFSPAS